MQTFKTVVVTLVLAGVCYGLFVILNKPPLETPVEIAGQTEADWQVNIDMDNLTMPGSESHGDTPPESFSPSETSAALDPSFEGRTVSIERPAANPGASNDTFSQAPPLVEETQRAGITPTDSFDATWTSATRNLEQNELAIALFTLSPLLDRDDLDAGRRTRVQNLLDQLAGTVIYSSEHHLEPPRVVQQGETLELIAQQYKISKEFLARINGIAAPYTLIPGESIKVVRGPFSAQLNRNRQEMVVYLQRYYAGRFAVSVGPDAPSAGGVFNVAEMLPGRAFYGPDGVEIPATDPRNPYGQHWIGLGGNAGIHATPNGAATATGSIGLSPADAADAFILLSRDSRVSVR